MRKKIVARRIQSLSGRRKFLVLLLPCRYYQQGKRVTASCLSNPLLFFFFFIWEGAFLPASLLNGGQIWYDKEKKKRKDEWEGTCGRNFLMSWTKQLGKPEPAVTVAQSASFGQRAPPHLHSSILVLRPHLHFSSQVVGRQSSSGEKKCGKLVAVPWPWHQEKNMPSQPTIPPPSRNPRTTLGSSYK